MSKAKILYITYDGLTDPLGQSQIIPYLAGVSKAGYAVTIISCEKPQRNNQYEIVKKILDENNIRWHPIRYTKKPPVLSTVYDILKITKAAKDEFRKNPFDIVHCRSYIPSLIGLNLKRKFSVKFIFDMRGFWADERVEGNIWNLNNPVFKIVYSYFKKKEKEFLTEADSIVSLTQNAKDEIQSWKRLTGQPLPLRVIPCCVDMELFNPERIKTGQLTELKKELGITPENFVLTYVGSLGTWYLLDEMLQFFNQLLHNKPQSKFLIVTNDPSETILKKAEALGISSESIIIRRANRSEMPLYIKSSNLAIFFIRPSFSKKASSPVKQGEIMSMGIPIVCNAGIGDTDRIIKDSEAGIAITEFSDKQYLRVVNQLEQLLQLPSSNIRNGAKKYYLLQNGVDAYISIYEELLSKEKY